MKNGLIKTIALTAAIAVTSMPVFAGNKSGYGELMVFQTINSSYVMGSFVAGLAENDDGLSAMGVTAGVITGGTAGYYCGSNIADSAGRLSSPQAHYINSASAWGAAYGYMLGYAASEFYDSMLLSSLMDASATIAASHLAYTYDLNSNSIAAVNSGGIWGAIFALELNYMLNSSPGKRTSIMSSLIIGSAAGLTATAMIDGNDKFSRGEVAINDLYGVLGGIVGLCVSVTPILCNSKVEKETMIAATMIGSIIGLYLGYSRDSDSGGSSRSSRAAAGQENRSYYFNIPAAVVW